jgi:hypothetical protein
MAAPTETPIHAANPYPPPAVSGCRAKLSGFEISERLEVVATAPSQGCA